jgi:hypothetical protein
MGGVVLRLSALAFTKGDAMPVSSHSCYLLKTSFVAY